MGSIPSFTWQSIFWDRELLEHGLRWRIGDGRLVHICGQPWISYARYFTVQSIPKHSFNSCVSKLISASGAWDDSKMYSTFNFLEAKMILSIPLLSQNSDRRL